MDHGTSLILRDQKTKRLKNQKTYNKVKNVYVLKSLGSLVFRLFYFVMS